MKANQVRENTKVRKKDSKTDYKFYTHLKVKQQQNRNRRNKKGIKND